MDKWALDYDHWAAYATWTLDEALALSLDLCPTQLHATLNYRPSPFSMEYTPTQAEYNKRKPLVDRAVTGGELSARPPPHEFLRWAKGRFSVPDELTQAVAARGGAVQSVQEECAALREQVERLTAELERLKQERPRWPWGSFETDYLRIMAVTVEQFWSEYLENPESGEYDTNTTIAEWIQAQPLSTGTKMSERWAQAMARFIRPQGLADGERKQRKAS